MGSSRRASIDERKQRLSVEGSRQFEARLRAGPVCARRDASAASCPPPNDESNDLANQDARAFELMARVLAKAEFRAGEPFALERLAAQLGVAPRYTKLLRRWHVELAQAGFIDASALLTEKYAATVAADRVSPVPGYWPRTTEDVIAALRGERHVLELMDDDIGVLENIRRYHSGTEHSKSLNALLAERVRSFLGDTPKPRIEVLEVGAGVGGTTESVLEALPSGRYRYRFTDISNAFFAFVRGRLARYEIEYGIYDIDEPPEEFGLEQGRYDVLIGSNAVHCARRLAPTLRHFANLLTPGGLLVMREITQPRPAHAILPGLIPGFSQFEDERTRASTPLVSAGVWRDLLHGASFGRVLLLPTENTEHDLGEHVISARKGEL